MEMGSIWSWGLDVIRTLQHYQNPILDNLMRLFTAVGTEEAYMAVVCWLYWCGQRTLGRNLSVVLLLGGIVNSDLKQFFSHPRPFELDSSLQLVGTSGYGFPSGHAQTAVLFWGYLGTKTQWRLKYAVVVPMILLIGLSRIYLGVHFPTDVLAGWLIGLVILMPLLMLESRFWGWVRSLAGHARWALWIMLPLTLAMLYPVPGASRLLGVLCGLGLGETLHDSSGDELASPAHLKILRFACGLLVLLATMVLVRWILGAWVSEEDALTQAWARFLAGGAYGLWISWGASLLFDRLRLRNPGNRD